MKNLLRKLLSILTAISLVMFISYNNVKANEMQPYVIVHNLSHTDEIEISSKAGNTTITDGFVFVDATIEARITLNTSRVFQDVSFTCYADHYDGAKYTSSSTMWVTGYSVNTSTRKLTVNYSVRTKIYDNNTYVETVSSTGSMVFSY